MTILGKLIAHFERFPGIGSRQAKRFAYHLLTEEHERLVELSDLIKNIQSEVSCCESCFRFFSNGKGRNVCLLCTDPNRDHGKLMVLERDSDLEAVERSRVYDGLYFVLGGTVPLLEGDDTSKLRGGALKHIVNKRSAEGLKEIILGFSVNPDGENTSRYIESLIKDVLSTGTVTLSYLGRGLSTGSELEYADPETIKNALKNRS